MGETENKGYMCRILDCPGRRPECSHEDGRFISQESFVGLPAGTEVPMHGTVVRCALCEKNGVVERIEGGLVVVHVQDTEVFGDGSRVDFQEAHPVPKT